MDLFNFFFSVGLPENWGIDRRKTSANFVGHFFSSFRPFCFHCLVTRPMAANSRWTNGTQCYLSILKVCLLQPVRWFKSNNEGLEGFWLYIRNGFVRPTSSNKFERFFRAKVRARNLSKCSWFVTWSFKKGNPCYRWKVRKRVWHLQSHNEQMETGVNEKQSNTMQHVCSNSAVRQIADDCEPFSNAKNNIPISSPQQCTAIIQLQLSLFEQCLCCMNFMKHWNISLTS